MLLHFSLYWKKYQTVFTTEHTILLCWLLPRKMHRKSRYPTALIYPHAKLMHYKDSLHVVAKAILQLLLIKPLGGHPLGFHPTTTQNSKHKESLLEEFPFQTSLFSFSLWSSSFFKPPSVPEKAHSRCLGTETWMKPLWPSRKEEELEKESASVLSSLFQKQFTNACVGNQSH